MLISEAWNSGLISVGRRVMCDGDVCFVTESYIGVITHVGDDGFTIARNDGVCGRGHMGGVEGAWNLHWRNRI